MKFSTAIHSIIKGDDKWNLTRLADSLGMKRQAISNRINRSESVRLSNAIEMSEALGYSVVLVPDTVKILPQGSKRITLED